jgi:predicted nucleotidyltransferase
MDILNLKKSKTKAKILQLFFSDPAKSYYLRELERILNISVGTIRREILSLEKSGLFKSRRQGNLLYFFLNQAHPLYQELKSIIFKTIGIEGQLRAALKNIKNIKAAFIFGSFARGAEDTFSDVDLMIIGKPNEDTLIRKISPIEKSLDREINYSIFSLEDFRNGLKTHEIFLEDILKSSKIFIIGKKDVVEKIIKK